MEQIKYYDLPPNPTKMTDTRSNKYIEHYGKTCWEVDALKPQVLTQIVETNIQDIIDMHLYNRVIIKENAGIQELKDFIKTRKNKKL
jgi:hypothetical protein